MSSFDSLATPEFPAPAAHTQFDLDIKTETYASAEDTPVKLTPGVTGTCSPTVICRNR